MTREEQKLEALSHLKTGFSHFAEARRHLTLGEFERAVTDHLESLGGQGFVASIGSAILAGTAERSL
jgi:hypothetical protein